MKKVILHLCADVGSDSYIWEQEGYEVIKVGKAIGVENFIFTDDVFGIICNPPCTEFSTARASGKARSPQEGMSIVNHCLRIIKECKPKFWVLENPARGVLKNFLGKPRFTYQPWQFGSPWTKATALWGDFNIPEKLFTEWESVPKIEGLYTRPNRAKPSLAFMHKSHIKLIPEFKPFEDKVKDDLHFRSLCSQGFAKAFFESNKYLN